MNKSLIFRILGALSSALIVVAVFVPFFMVNGYSESLWFSNGEANAIFLPILIIIFGLIGIIFFALNYKTEFAYSTCGAIAFFIIMTTVDYINQDKFNTLSIGYYLLVAGTILTGVMAFITNKKSKIKVIEPINEVNNENISFNAINGLDDTIKVQNTPIMEPLDNVINPVENNISPLPIPEISYEQSINENPTPFENNTNVSMGSSIPEINPVIEQFNPGVLNVQPLELQQEQVENPVIGQFNSGVLNAQPLEPQQEQVVNPVIGQFNPGVLNVQPLEPQQEQVVNPVIGQFNSEIPSVQSTDNSLFSFGNSDISNKQSQDSFIPLSNINGISSENTVTTDIFGQPINK